MANNKVKSVKKQLTREQLEKMLLTQCKTEQELKNFIKYFMELELPDCMVSRHADSDPFHMVWQMYDICVNKHNPNNIQELLYVAARGSGKSLGAAIAEVLIILHDQRDTAHIGAILSQAKRCYSYQQKFFLNQKLKPILMPHDRPEDQRILEKTNMEKSSFNIKGEKVTLEVLPCTLKACLISTAKAKDGNGVVKPLSDFIIGDLISSPDGYAEIIDNQLDYQECIRIELDNGLIIEGTLDHKVWTQRGWVELQNLTDVDDVRAL